MPLKKSAVLLIVLSASSVGLLVFSSSIPYPEPVIKGVPERCTPVNCCSQFNKEKLFSPWDMISQIMLRSVA